MLTGLQAYRVKAQVSIDFDSGTTSSIARIVSEFTRIITTDGSIDLRLPMVLQMCVLLVSPVSIYLE